MIEQPMKLSRETIEQRRADESQFDVNMDKNCEIFANNGLSNIFDGSLIPQIDKYKNEINQIKVIGYRFESDQRENIKVICDQPKDENGIYSATVFLDGVRRKGRKNTSSFFPKHWKKDDVVQAISEAYENKILRNAEINQYVGKTQNGIEIILWLDDAGKITDAMPVRCQLKELRAKQRSKRICKECGKSKSLICLEHNKHLLRQSFFKRIPKKLRYYSKKFYFDFAKKLGFVE